MGAGKSGCGLGKQIVHEFEHLETTHETGKAGIFLMDELIHAGAWYYWKPGSSKEFSGPVWHVENCPWCGKIHAIGTWKTTFPRNPNDPPVRKYYPLGPKVEMPCRPGVLVQLIRKQVRLLPDTIMKMVHDAWPQRLRERKINWRRRGKEYHEEPVS